MGRKLKNILGTILLAGASLLPLKAQNPAERHMINVDYRSDKYNSWASLTKDEKINWMDTLTWDTLQAYRLAHKYPDGTDCIFAANQTSMDIYDYEKLDKNFWEKEGYTFDSPVKYKLPVYSVSIIGKNIPEGHKANCIFIGGSKDSKKDFNNWYFFDPVEFRYPRLFPGIGRMPTNSDINIQFYNFTDTTAPVSQILKFHLDSINKDSIAVPRLVSYSPQTLILTNPVTDKNPPEVELTGLKNDTVYSNLPTQAICKIHDGEFADSVSITPSWKFDVYSETFLDSCWYKLNDGKKTEIPYYIKDSTKDGVKYFATYSTSETIDLKNLKEGGNTLLIYRSDIAGNKKMDTINFVIDTIVDSIKKPVSEAVSVYPEFSVYPNPVTNKLKVKGLEKGVIDIYDISGRRLNEINYRENEEIDFSNYARGVYVLKTENSEGKSLTKKVIKQ